MLERRSSRSSRGRAFAGPPSRFHVWLSPRLNYRSSLQLAAQEGAFEGSLAGHGPADATATATALWANLEPGAAPAEVSTSVQGNLVGVQAHTFAPALLPVPVPPFTRMLVTVRAVHTVERFQPGSQP